MPCGRDGGGAGVRRVSRRLCAHRGRIPRPSACPTCSPLVGALRAWFSSSSSSPPPCVLPVQGAHWIRSRERLAPPAFGLPHLLPPVGALRAWFSSSSSPPPCVLPVQGAHWIRSRERLAPPAFGLPHLLPPHGGSSCMVFLLPLLPGPSLPIRTGVPGHTFGPRPPAMTKPRQSSPGRRSPSPPGSWRHSPLPRDLAPALPPAPWAADGVVPPVAACATPCTASPDNACAACVHARGRRPLRVRGGTVESASPVVCRLGGAFVTGFRPWAWAPEWGCGGSGLPGGCITSVDRQEGPPPAFGGRLAGGNVPAGHGAGAAEARALQGLKVSRAWAGAVLAQPAGGTYRAGLRVRADAGGPTLRPRPSRG